jgi:hypothetical protein
MPPQGPVPSNVEAMPPEGGELPTNLPPMDQAVAAQGAKPQKVRMPDGFENVPLTAEEGMQKLQG